MKLFNCKEPLVDLIHRLDSSNIHNFCSTKDKGSAYLGSEKVLNEILTHLVYIKLCIRAANLRLLRILGYLLALFEMAAMPFPCNGLCFDVCFVQLALLMFKLF